ncbi:winged helix family transcriptional regulator [Paenibacillus anaericanus]|uniref:Winged helix family transcriptional regulator n=1 Tax=Paenibacillus anaericanus TaxID=170367 RepID=A0A3S1DFT9_9BACL|nr:winged helix-turn-helix domain-containing protein [Paenibacillus anaericanus]RUT43950.1 winged helix family transcriptional regulator [Paenibacillus anaericanus]
MAQLIFDQAGYLVKSGTDTIVLLAKEYALLEFLYYNRNHTFTREQLLDRVWMLEYPSERTVDDHIYRLRKKLHHWDHITINTVRGYGYTLTLNERRQVDNPSVHDEEMKNAIGEMFEKYHRFGQSKSMLALETQQDVLGFEMDPFYQVYLRFIQGDIPWFLGAEEIPLQERLYWLLLLYRGMSSDPNDVLRKCQLALDSGILPPEQHREMEILNILELYGEAGLPLEAISKFPITRKRIEEDKLSSFAMPVALMQMYVCLLAEQMIEVERISCRLERFLKDTPYLREIGRYHILKGLWLLAQGKRSQGVDLLDEGLEVLRMSINAPLLLISVSQILLYVQNHVPDSELEHKYQGVYAALDREYGLSKYRHDVERTLEQALNVR